MCRWGCASRNTIVQKSRKTNIRDEVGSWLDGLFTDGLCTAAAIGKLLWQLTLEVSEGDISLQLEWFLQFVPVIGSRELEGKAAKRGVGFDQWNIPTGAHAMGGCCYGDQWAEIRRSFTLQRLIDDLGGPVGLVTIMYREPANESIQVTMVGSRWGFGDKTDGTVIDCIQLAEVSVGGYFVNDIAEVKDRQDK